MAPGSRRLPEDSVVTSLSEIQAILQTSETAQRKPAAKPPGQDPPAVTDAAPRTIGAPVPSAAEIRATREARWQEEMAEAQRAPAPPARRAGAVTWILAAVGLAGGGLSGWFFWPVPPAVIAPAAEPVLAVEPPSPPSQAPVAATPPTAAPVAATAVESAPPTAPRSVASARVQARRGVSTDSRQRASAIDAAFGPRPTQSRGKIVAKPKVNRKKTRADAQLDSVLDGL